MNPCSAISNSDIPQLRYLECIFGRLVGSLLAFAAIALFLMLIMGGLKYTTSGGDPKSLDSAWKTITYAVMGLILIASSYLILRLIGTITGADVFNFTIYR